MTGRDDIRRQAILQGETINDDEFVTQIGLTVDSPVVPLALALREVLSEFSGIPVEFLRPETRLSNLVGLGRLDSLDTVDFILTLEEHASINIPVALAERIPGFFELEQTNTDLLIAEFVVNAAHYLHFSLRSSG